MTSPFNSTLGQPHRHRFPYSRFGQPGARWGATLRCDVHFKNHFQVSLSWFQKIHRTSKKLILLAVFLPRTAHFQVSLFGRTAVRLHRCLYHQALAATPLATALLQTNIRCKPGAANRKHSRCLSSQRLICFLQILSHSTQVGRFPLGLVT